MSLYSEKGNFLFIHNRKTAGTSIREMLCGNWPDAVEVGLAHDTSASVRTLAGEQVWEQAYTFSFVRHPYTWVESMRRYISRTEGYPLYDLVKDPVAFTHGLADMCALHVQLHDGPMSFQHEYTRGVDCVYNFESAEDAVEDIATVTGSTMQIVHRNWNGFPPLPVAGAYRRAIAERFKMDFHLLNYEE